MKTTDQSQVTNKLCHIMLYTSPSSRFKLTSVVIGTDYIRSCKSSYHMITVTTVPPSLNSDTNYNSMHSDVLCRFFMITRCVHGSYYCIIIISKTVNTYNSK